MLTSVTKSAFYFGLVLLSSFLVASISVSAQDVAVCGGFVIASPELRARSSGVQVDYSLIKVKLKTRNEGLLKDASECAPTGYYSVPVYDKGQFVLEVEGPAGWNFEPKAVDVVIDANNQCQGGQDINFAITGFKVQGAVRSEACESEKDAATKGITIALKSTDGSVSTTTTTVAGGRYEFTNVAPGSYVVEATHPQWSLASKSNPTPSKKSSTSLQWTWDNAKVQEDFLVTGFDISGQVTSEKGDEALSGVEFLLYSKTPSKRESLPCIGSSAPSTANDASYPEGRPLCLTKSTESGFRFENVPCGSYKIVPYYRGTHTTFDLVPKQVDVVVKGGESVRVAAPFKVTGFSVVGKVVDARGQGVADAKIMVNGQQKTKTGADGSYKLEQMASGDYTIEASKEHAFFSTLANFRLSPSIPQLPNIVANAYHLCGKVEIAQAPAGISPTKSRTIVIKGAATKTTTTDASGNFCAVVTPGRYTVSVQLGQDELKAGLLLKPTEQEVTIQAAPVLDIKFGQSLLSVSGAVTCLETPCSSSLSVVLSSTDRNYRVSSALTGDKFTFRSVLPGSYKVSVEIANWCWRDNQESIQFEVVNSDVNNLEFVQSGYKVSVRSPSDEIKLNYKSTNGKEHGEAVPLKKGTNEFCVATPGIYDLTLASCFKFDKDAYRFDTRNPAVVDLVIKQYQLVGTVEVSGLADDQKDPNLSVKVKRVISKTDTDGSVLTELKPTLVNTRKAEKTTFFTYQYTYWAVIGEELRFIPASALLLFYPTRYIDVSVLKGGECPSAITPFTARPGLFLKGKISPPLADAIIKVINNKDNAVLVETKTAADGSYSAGPLYDDQEYTVTAERENYQFVKTKEGFNANKLGQIQITVTDEATKEPLQGVLLSLSGSDGYRSNTVTNAQGTYRFLGINPGDYFVRLTLKEYMFVPASKSIKVNQGEDVNVSFEAKRTAFSAYGFVQTLNGEPEKFVTIEATGPNGEYEETQTDGKGQFRIRGLVPKVTYTLRVKNNAESKVERASPLEQKVTIPATGGDIKDIKFIIFKRSASLQITGVVASKREWLSKLRVELYREDELVKTISLGPSNYFDFHSLVPPKGAKAKYTLRLKSSLPREQYVYELSSADVEFGPGETHKQVNLSFEVAPHTLPQELVSTPFWALLFGLIPILGIFYPQKVLSLAQKIASGKAFEKPEAEVAFGKDPDLAYHRQLVKQSKKQGAKGGRK